MSRLQKKCLVASAALHTLLLLVLLIGPAFLVSKTKPAPDMPVLDYIPAILIDEALSGGGTPNAVLPPPNAQPLGPVAPPATQPPKAAPQPELKKHQPKETEAPETKPDKPSPDAKNKLEVGDKKLVTRWSPKKSAPKQTPSKNDAESDARQSHAERQALFNGVLERLQKNAPSSTVIGIPGPGGPAYANYGQVIKSIYEKAWNRPTEAEHESDEVDVEVTIWRDGTVIRSKIVRRSGNPALDKSVENVLERVRTVPAFPAGAKDDQRTFNITFRLKANRLLG
jgi:TonB family protein